MPPPPELIDVNGRFIRLDTQIGKGGEGAVYSILNDSTTVAKVYHKEPDAQTIEKLESMVRHSNPHLLSLLAWPMGLLYQPRTRKLAGFVMPRILNCFPIQSLYNPVQRLRSFPQAGWNFQVRAAINLAAVFEEVHKAGCLVGDVNQSNIQVSNQAMVRLIDCDSFQYRKGGKVYLCEVGVAHYIPPELQGQSLRGVVRTENHGMFGLAVLIYQLLFVGRHPYGGLYTGPGDPSYEQLIKEFRFAQGPGAAKWNMAPPPHTPTFSDIPPDIGNLFRRAFEKGSEAGNRPHPKEWMASLQKLENDLVECGTDSGHFFWRGSRSCVWCRLADRGGPEFYFGVARKTGSFTVDEAKLEEILKRLKASGPVDFPYSRKQYAPILHPIPEPLPQGLLEHRSTELVLSIATVICLVGLLIGIINRVIFLASLLGFLGFGIWLGIQIYSSPWHLEYRRRKKNRNRALQGLEKIEDVWKKNVLGYRHQHSEIKESIQKLVLECRSLGELFQREFQQLSANAESTARIRHLRLNLISDADIPRIGAGRKQVLAANGILSAADVEGSKIRGISGFGDVLTTNLLSWKELVLREFRFNPESAISPTERQSLTVKFRNRQKQILAESFRQIEKLESLAPIVRGKVQKIFPEIERALAQLEQAEADLQILNKRN